VVLLYNTEQGPARYIFIFEASWKEKFSIETNKLYLIDIDSPASLPMKLLQFLLNIEKKPRPSLFQKSKAKKKSTNVIPESLPDEVSLSYQK